MKVIVLGHKGMLGHMVKHYLESQGIKVKTCNHRWSSNEMKDYIKTTNANYIINCIGAIPQRRVIFDINYELPIWLDKNAPCKVIHPGTDCDDNDDYGISKRKATDYIVENGKQTKIIKTSILGTELQGNASLLEWFLSQEGEVDGYTKAIWTGNTTLEWSKHCYDIMLEWNKFEVETVLQGETISKYDLLKTIAKIWNKTIKINPVEKGTDRRLDGDIKTPNIKSQLIELKQFGNIK
jgi:dTDP-4-dehydrorhamnose reductase